MAKKKIKWQPILKTSGSLLFQWYVFEGDKEERFCSSLNLKIGLRNGKIVSREISIDVNEWTKLERALTNKIDCESGFFKNFIQSCYRYSERLILTAKKIERMKNLGKLENSELLKIYKEYQSAVLDLVPFLNTTLVLDGILYKKILDVFDKELGIKKEKEQDLLLSKLVIPKKKSFFVKEQRSLLNMALKVQRNKEADIEKEIENHIKRYGWTPCLAYAGRFQTKKDVIERISHFLQEGPKEKLAQAGQIRKETQEDFRKAFGKIKNSKRTVELIDFAREFIYLKQYRLDIFFKAHYHIYALFEEIAKRFGLRPQEVVYLTGEEIIEWLKEGRGVKKGEVKNRMKDFALIKIDDEYTLLSGQEVKKAGPMVIKEEKVEGTVANRGRINANVRLVFGAEDIEKVKRGDIIVSPMTTPELMPALSKSSGIITDFGGMLCHAALISRELGIPCIVGTKKATKVFKDGDLVELNAYDGIARKLEKAK